MIQKSFPFELVVFKTVVERKILYLYYSSSGGSGPREQNLLI